MCIETQKRGLVDPSKLDLAIDMGGKLPEFWWVV